MVVVNTAPSWRSINNTGLLLRSLGGGIQLVKDIFYLLAALLKRRFDLVHLTTSGQLALVRDFIIAFVVARFDVPLVYHIHFGRVPLISDANSFEWRLMKKVMERASAVIAIDLATFLAIERQAPHVNVILTPNCVDISALPIRVAFSRSVKIALFVGWVISTKGIKELLESWVSINPAGWKLDIVGPVDPNYRQQLLKQFHSDSIEFLGELPHVQAMERMAACDLFVLPSYTEGFPNVVVEAMALGKAIIATSVGAIPEMLGDDAGILVEAKNTQSLIHAIQLGISDPTLRERLGTRAYEKAVLYYSIDVVFDRYLQIWRNSLTRN